MNRSHGIVTDTRYVLTAVFGVLTVLIALLASLLNGKGADALDSPDTDTDLHKPTCAYELTRLLRP